MKKLILIAIVGGVMSAQSFEVASIKQNTRYSWVRRPWSPNVDCAPIGHCGVSGNRFTEEFASLDDLIMDAFGVKRYQIVNLPSWGDTGKDVYDVEARAAEGQTLSLAEARRMLQTLLAERFQLKVHHEMRELPVYALVKGKGAPKLKPTDKQCAFPPVAGARAPKLRRMVEGSLRFRCGRSFRRCFRDAWIGRWWIRRGWMRKATARSRGRIRSWC